MSYTKSSPTLQGLFWRLSINNLGISHDSCFYNDRYWDYKDCVLSIFGPAFLVNFHSLRSCSTFFGVLLCCHSSCFHSSRVPSSFIFSGFISFFPWRTTLWIKHALCRSKIFLILHMYYYRLRPVIQPNRIWVHHIWHLVPSVSQSFLRVRQFPVGVPALRKFQYGSNDYVIDYKVQTKLGVNWMSCHWILNFS